jgi:hypothetical protein
MGGDPLIVHQSGDPNGVQEYWSDQHAKEESLAITERGVPGLEMPMTVAADSKGECVQQGSPGP